MGLGTQLIAWPMEFCLALVYRVIAGPDQSMPEKLLRDLVTHSVERSIDTTAIAANCARE